MYVFRIIRVRLPHRRGRGVRSSIDSRGICDRIYSPWISDQFERPHCCVLSNRNSFDRSGLGSRDWQNRFHPWPDPGWNVAIDDTGHSPRFLGGLHTALDCDHSRICCGSAREVNPLLGRRTRRGWRSSEHRSTLPVLRKGRTIHTTSHSCVVLFSTPSYPIPTASCTFPDQSASIATTGYSGP